MLWAEFCPHPNLYVEVLTPSTLECDWFEDGDFIEVIKVKWDELGGP